MFIKSILLLSFCASSIHGFPGASGGKGAGPAFDPKEQFIKTTGEHSFKPPGPDDVRGPCPGLNALANHNYLPRNGFATITQFIEGCTTVFGMGFDLATVLAVYGAAVDGNLLGWYIGGPSLAGIGVSHNNYEGDSSALRADLHQYGSHTKLVMSQFYDLYNRQPDPETANYDMKVLTNFRGKRFNDSIAKNPVFFYAPFAGPIVSQAAFSFIYRFMANKSADHPEGRLDKKVLKSFMSIYGPEDNLRWVPGHERIPDNWYTRNKNDPYNLNYFSEDVTYIGTAHPEVLQAGCNQGKVNTYKPLGKSSSSKKTSDVLCTGFQYALQTSMKGGVLNAALQQALEPVMSTLGCSAAADAQLPLGLSCPGFSLFGGPKGKIVKGAIQDE